MVDAGGYEIDGVSGATVTSDAVRKAVAQALGEEIEETTAAETEAERQLLPRKTWRLREVFRLDRLTQRPTETAALQRLWQWFRGM